MGQILWHSQRKRGETVKTNLLLKYIGPYLLDLVNLLLVDRLVNILEHSHRRDSNVAGYFF